MSQEDRGDLQRVIERVANIPLDFIHDHISTSMPNEIIKAARRVQYKFEEYVESGLPKHLPMGVTAEGQGPTEPDEPHHRVCWCGDPKCYWTIALAAERAAGEADGRAMELGDWINTPDAAKYRAGAANAWPCDNYLSPMTCLSAGSSRTARCSFCATMARLGAADIMFGVKTKGPDVLAKWGVRSRHGEWSDEETRQHAIHDILHAALEGDPK